MTIDVKFKTKHSIAHSYNHILRALMERMTWNNKIIIQFRPSLNYKSLQTHFVLTCHITTYFISYLNLF